MKDNRFVWILTIVLAGLVFLFLIVKTIKLYKENIYLNDIENKIENIRQEVEQLEKNYVDNQEVVSNE